MLNCENSFLNGTHQYAFVRGYDRLASGGGRGFDSYFFCWPLRSDATAAFDFIACQKWFRWRSVALSGRANRLTLVWQTVYMTSELWFMLERNSQTMLAAFVAVVPGLVSICIGAWVIWQIAAKRSPNAVAFAVVGVWLMGPCAAMLQSWYFGLALTEMSLIQLFGWSIGWSLYFVLSPRVALTYGTPRGKRIAEGLEK